MESSKEISNGAEPAGENPNPNLDPSAGGDSLPAAPPPRGSPSRTPFTSLSQVDADLVLARALQEQERAYMMLMLGGGGGSYHGSVDSWSYEEEDEMGSDDDIDDDHDHAASEEIDYDDDNDEGGALDAIEDNMDPGEFESDEAFARALQEAEERHVTDRLMSLEGLGGEDDEEEGESDHQDELEEMDPDEFSYEELIALSEVVGEESRGLNPDTIASLPSVIYKEQACHAGNIDQCVICRLDYEDGEPLVLLSCKHAYHSECISKWLQINKVCPICSVEVSASTK